MRQAQRAGQHRLAGWRWGLVAGVFAVMAATCPPIEAAVPAPERVVVPLTGGRPQVEGTPTPAPGARLPSLREAAPPQRPSAAAERAERRQAEAARPRPAPVPRRKEPPPRRVPPPDWMILLDGGAVALPDAALRMATYEGFAPVRGLALDVALYRVTSERHAAGGRLGVAIPTMPARNWWPEGSRPTYIDVDAVFVDLAFAYSYWRPLLGRLAWIVRADLGATIVAGRIRRVATLPTCKPGQEETCPHWRVAGDLSDALPTSVLPALRLTTGLAFELGAGLHVRVEAGLRDLPWLGVGFGLRR